MLRRDQTLVRVELAEPLRGTQPEAAPEGAQVEAVGFRLGETRAGLLRRITKWAVSTRRGLGIPATGIPGRGQSDAHRADGEHAYAHEHWGVGLQHARSFPGNVVDWVARRGRLGPPLGV